MNQTNPISENEMILAFLQAEIDSPRFGHLYRKLLAYAGETRAIIDRPDLLNQKENAIRKELLVDVRGYNKNIFLFENFPKDVTWKRVSIETKKILTFLYPKYPYWTELSGGTRFVGDGAKNVSAKDKNITAVVQEVENGKKFAEIITVTNSNKEYIILEGCTRISAYAISLDKLPKTISIIVGFSPTMNNWIYF